MNWQKKQQKAKQHPEADILIKMPKITSMSIDLDLDMYTNIQNMTCLGMIMSICNKQHLATFEAEFIRKLSNVDAEMKKRVAYKKT